MDFDFDTSPTNNEQNNPPEESKITNLDQMLNMEFQPFPEQNQTKNDSNQLNMDFIQTNLTEPLQNVDNEEQKRIMDRQKEAEMRKQKINEKIKKEEELRIEIRKKAVEYLTEFEQKRQENIAQKRKSLEEKEKNKNEGNDTGNNSDSWPASFSLLSSSEFFILERTLSLIDNAKVTKMLLCAKYCSNIFVILTEFFL